MNGKVTGWGRYVPERVLTNEEISTMVDTTDEWIRTRSGIQERRIASDDENTSDMAVEAGRAALAQAGVAAEDLDLIIVATSSPDFLTPPVSSQVQDKLGAGRVGAFTMVVGCPGFLYAMVTAEQFLSSGSFKRILVVGVELLSRNLDWSDRTTCVLFGDGAGAVVMEASDGDSGLRSFVFGSDGSGYEHLIQPSGGVAVPPSHESLDRGDNFLKMNGREVFKFATRVMGSSLMDVLEKAQMGLDEIDLFIAHQANARIIEAATRAAGLPEEKVFINVNKYGNTSAASIPIALFEAIEAGRAGPGSTIAFVAFGAGLTWAAAIYKL